MNQSTNDRIIELVAEVLRHDKSQITADSRFVEDLEANSLDVVELACLLEGEFGIRLPEPQIAAIRTVGDAVRLLNETKR